MVHNTSNIQPPDYTKKLHQYGSRMKAVYPEADKQNHDDPSGVGGPDLRVAYSRPWKGKLLPNS
jgi:hypothetical protein